MQPDPSEIEDDALPASMADLFFALVAVVVFLILALVPNLKAHSSPSPGDLDMLRHARIRLGGATPTILIAEAGGLRIVGNGDRLVSLGDILDDEALSARLQVDKAARTSFLIAVTDEGQEASFLFDALAGSLDLPEVQQIRLPPPCITENCRGRP